MSTLTHTGNKVTEIKFTQIIHALTYPTGHSRKTKGKQTQTHSPMKTSALKYGAAISHSPHSHQTWGTISCRMAALVQAVKFLV